MPFFRALALVGLGLTAVAGSAAAQSAPDSITFVPRYEVVDTTRVERGAMTLREIIARCVEGERTKLSGHRDMTYTATVRTLLLWKKKKEVQDVVLLVHENETGFTRAVLMAERVTRYKLDDGAWVSDPDEEEEDPPVEVGFNSEDDENIFTRIPFFLEEQQEFDFELLDRTLEEDRVIFKIAFRPRSDFKPLPSGTVYVDTDRFRIIHEEFEFDTNPFPLFVKGVNRISRHWRELPTGEWVTGKLMMDVDLRGGWTGVIPHKVTVAIVLDDFEFDTGYDVHRFGER